MLLNSIEKISHFGNLLEFCNVQPEHYQLQQPLMFPGENRKAFFSALNNDDIQAKYEEKGFFTKSEIKLVAEGMAKQSMEEGIISFPQYIQILGRKAG